MLIEDVLGVECTGWGKERKILLSECHQFLKESNGHPLYKLLPCSYHDFQKVKVRQRKKDFVAEVFNRAFHEVNNFRQRAVFTYGSKMEISGDLEPFFVFPIDGYKFVYCKEVQNSSENYRRVLDTLFENIENSSAPVEIVSDLVKLTYVRTSLIEGISSGAEIIFYNIPYFYVVRGSLFQQYTKLLPDQYNQ